MPSVAALAFGPAIDPLLSASTHTNWGRVWRAFLAIVYLAFSGVASLAKRTDRNGRHRSYHTVLAVALRPAYERVARSLNAVASAPNLLGCCTRTGLEFIIQSCGFWIRIENCV